MYYRRKIVVEIIARAGGSIELELLFLNLRKVCARQENPAYYFVDSPKGKRSFIAEHDLTILERKRFISTHGGLITLRENINYELKYDDSQLIKNSFTDKPTVCDEQAKFILSENKKQKPVAERSSVQENSKKGFYTIGYEGVCLDQYLSKLIQHNIIVLVDVRKNAFSMKYGFSKKTLEKACLETGIEYIHLPELGIDSNKRKTLESQVDYDALFVEYKTNLKNNLYVLDKIHKLIRDKLRIAITCFERSVCQCHRGVVADEVRKTLSPNTAFAHI